MPPETCLSQQELRSHGNGLVDILLNSLAQGLEGEQCEAVDQMSDRCLHHHHDHPQAQLGHPARLLMGLDWPLKQPQHHPAPEAHSESPSCQAPLLDPSPCWVSTEADV